MICMKLKRKWLQEQRPQLKMKFSLRYNMKIVVFWGHKNLVGAIFLVEEDYSMLVLMMIEF